MSELKVILDIKRVSEDTDESVYFKVDGGRFDSDKTLKLTQDCRYKLKITIKPEHQLSGIIILGQKAEFEDISGNDSLSIYQCQCNTNGLEATKKNQRMTLPIVLEIKDEGEIHLNIQCKLYSTKDLKHSIWGTALHHIDAQCDKKQGQLAYNVKELAFK